MNRIIIIVFFGDTVFSQDRGQYHRSSGGSYNYGYNTGDGVAKVEVKRKDGSVVGSYRFTLIL